MRKCRSRKADEGFHVNIRLTVDIPSTYFKDEGISKLDNFETLKEKLVLLENVDFLYDNNKKIIQIKDHVANLSDTDFSSVCTD